MASTNYLARIIVKEKGAAVTGSYKLLVKAKSIPAPVEAPSAVETTTFEDAAQTFVEGIKKNGAKTVSGNLEKDYLDAVEALKGKVLDIFHLYGPEGTGEVAKYHYQGTVVATPKETSGTDGVLEMEVTITPNTVAELVTDDYTVTKSDNTFTVAEA